MIYWTALTTYSHVHVIKDIAALVRRRANGDASCVERASRHEVRAMLAEAVARWAKRGNCQIGVSVHAVTDWASAAVDWRLFVPESWDDRKPTARPMTSGLRPR